MTKSDDPAMAEPIQEWPDPSEKRRDGALVKMLRAPVYAMFHSWRLFGYFYLIPPMFYYSPVKSAIGVAAYAAVHRRQWWQRMVHAFFGFGASRRHKIKNPYREFIKDDQRYLFTIHPHSVLADGWHSIIARNVDSFDSHAATPGPPKVGRRISLCFAPIIQHVPVHQEMYRDKCGAADKKAITKWWNSDEKTDPALIPGGFAESVFADANHEGIEYSYLKDRKGFIRICIEEGKDIVPMYTYGSTRMYNNTKILRGVRARFSQAYFLPVVLPIGWMGTSMPLTDNTTTVVFKPFPCSKYTLDQLDQCHQDYLAHLKFYFDKHKAECGYPDDELKFIGNDFKDDDSVAKTLQSVGLLRSRL